MNGGLWWIIGAIGGLLLTFLLGNKAGKLKAVEKQTEKLEEKVKDAEAEVEKARAAERNGETKAATQEKKAELAVRLTDVFNRLAANSPDIEKLNLPEKISQADADAIEIARQQAAQAKEFMLR